METRKIASILGESQKLLNRFARLSAYKSASEGRKS